MQVKGLWRSATALLGAALFAAACQGGANQQAKESNTPDDEQIEEGTNPYTNEGTDKSGSPLRKGLGGLNGQPDYCDNPADPCRNAEGDCDYNPQCTGAGSLLPQVCAADNGGRFTAATGGIAISTGDFCVAQHCLNGVQDGSETGVDCGGIPGDDCGSCTPNCSGQGAPGNADFCTFHCKCGAQQGDCDGNSTCTGGTICVNDVGNRFGVPGDRDFCLNPLCNNRVINPEIGETAIDCGGQCGPCTCTGMVAGSECTPGCPCGEDGGDCDSNLDCAPGLVCQEQGAIDRCHFVCNAWNPAADPGAPGSQQAVPCGDDNFGVDLLTVVPGFSFLFQGAPPARIMPTTNGVIDFGDQECQGTGGVPGTACNGNTASAIWVNYSFPQGPFRKAAVFFDDLYSCTNNQPGGAANNDIRYAVLGTAPNRTIVVSWSNISLFSQQTRDIGSYQIVMHETTNRIEYNYRNTGPTGVLSNDGSVTVGANNGAGGGFSTPFNQVTPQACFSIQAQ